MDGALPVAKRTRSRKNEMFRKMHEDCKKQRRIQEQTGHLGFGSSSTVLDVDVLLDEEDVVVETECITIEDSEEDDYDSNKDEEEVDEDDDDSHDDEEEEEDDDEDDKDYVGGCGTKKNAGSNSRLNDKKPNILRTPKQTGELGLDSSNVVLDDVVENGPVGEKDVVVETECITIEDSEEDNDDSNKDEEEVDEDDDSSEDDDDEEEEGEEYVTDNTNGEESEDDMIDQVQGDMNEGGKSEEFPKEADAVTGDERDRENIMVAVDPEENGDRLANNKAYLGNRMDKSMGMIFMCNSKTKKDCYRHKDLVVYNIEPTAFGCGFPSQVRFEVSEDCVPLPEEKFKRVIKDNYYQKNKFDFQLTSEQVKNLCKLFRATSKGSRLHGIGKAETHGLMDRERNRHADHRVEEPYRNLDQDWMVRNRPHREVPYRNVDHDRRAREMYREQEEHHTSVRDILYEESRDPYKWEVNASRMVALPSRPRLSPVTATVLHPPSSAYEEEMNAYRREPLYEEGRGLFFDLESRRREQIERRVASLPQHHDRPFLDAEFRHHQVIERHDHQVLTRPILNEPSYAATPREYHTTRYAPYHTNLQPEYRPSRPAYRY